MLQKLVHNAYCRLCHHSAIYYRVESKPYVKLFKLLTLIPDVSMSLPPKRDKPRNSLVDECFTEVINDKFIKGGRATYTYCQKEFDRNTSGWDQKSQSQLPNLLVHQQTYLRPSG